MIYLKAEDFFVPRFFSSIKLVLSFLLLFAINTIAHATTVRVHYDVGYGNRITIRGSKAPLSWNTGVSAKWTTSNIWVYSWSSTIGNVDIKPLINDVNWSTGGNYHILAGATVDIY